MSAQRFQAGRDRPCVAPLGALEHHVLDEVRDPQPLPGLVARAVPEPCPHRDRATVRHGLGEHGEAGEQPGSAINGRGHTSSDDAFVMRVPGPEVRGQLHGAQRVDRIERAGRVDGLAGRTGQRPAPRRPSDAAPMPPGAVIAPVWRGSKPVQPRSVVEDCHSSIGVACRAIATRDPGRSRGPACRSRSCDHRLTTGPAEWFAPA